MPGPDLPHAWLPLFAYIGPGADLSLIGYALTLGAFALTAVTATLLWPFYAFMRWVRGGKKKPEPAASAENAPGEARDKSPVE